MFFAYNLNNYVEGLNNWHKFKDSKPLSLDVAADRQLIAHTLDRDLSPENLSCDGEMPPDVVQARYEFLSKVCKELQDLDPTVKFYEFA